MTQAIARLAQSGLNARFIVSARAASDFGAYLNVVALSSYVYLLSDSVVHVSVFLFCRVAGGVTASLVGTPFFRRFVGRGSLFGFDLMRAALLALLLVLPGAQQMQVLPLIAFGIGLGNSMFAIGLNSQLPYLVAAEQRISANAWITSVAATGAVLGCLVSGLLVASCGYRAVIALNIVTYLAAAALIVPLRLIEFPEQASRTHRHGEWRALLDGLRGAPSLACTLLVSMADTLGSAAHNVGMPVLSKLLTPESASTTMGLLLAIWAAGKFGGARMASAVINAPVRARDHAWNKVGDQALDRTRDPARNESLNRTREQVRNEPLNLAGNKSLNRARNESLNQARNESLNRGPSRAANRTRMEQLFFLGVGLMSTGFILVFEQKSMPWPLLFAVLAGIGDGIAEVSLVSRAQAEPDSLRLPIFSLLTLMQMTGFGVGMLLVAPFYVWWPPSSVILLFHGLPLSMLAFVQILARRAGPAWRKGDPEGAG